MRSVRAACPPASRSALGRLSATLVLLTTSAIGLPTASFHATATEFAATGTAPSVAVASGGGAGQSCVLLRNGNVLFGAAAKIGGTICITRQDGAQINLHADQVEVIGGSIQELYHHRLKHRFEGDLKRIQSDVRWCLENGLVREAAADVLRARSLDPSDPHTVQLLRQIAARIKHDAGSQDSAGQESDVEPIRQVSHESIAPMPSPREDAAEMRPASESQASLLPDNSIYAFTAKIQPILMNRCVSCHANVDSNDREFQIHSSLRSKWAPKDVAMQNLEAVMQFVDFDDPQSSRIRVRASDGHGGRRYSFGTPGSSMMVALDQWLWQLAETADLTPWESALGAESSEDSLRPSAAPELSRLDQTESEPWQAGVTASSSETVSVGIPDLPAPIESGSSESEPAWPTQQKNSSGELRMRRMPKVENPFDPEIFNRRFHGH